jgi:hypothetical protein
VSASPVSASTVSASTVPAGVPARRGSEHEAIAVAGKDKASKETWRMPRLAMLAPAPMSAGRRVAMVGMWAYLVIAIAAVVVKVVLIATGH